MGGLTGALAALGGLAQGYAEPALKKQFMESVNSIQQKNDLVKMYSAAISSPDPSITPQQRAMAAQAVQQILGGAGKGPKGNNSKPGGLSSVVAFFSSIFHPGKNRNSLGPQGQPPSGPPQPQQGPPGPPAGPAPSGQIAGPPQRGWSYRGMNLPPIPTPGPPTLEQSEQLRVKEAKDMAAAKGEIDTQQRKEEWTESKQHAEEIGLKAGTSEYVNAVYGRSIIPSKPESLDQAATDVFRDWREGKLSDAERDKAIDVIGRLKGAEKPTKPSEEDKGIADHLQAQGLSDTPGNRDKARVWYSNLKKANASSTSFTKDDAKDIADAIADGEQPPTVQWLYRNAAPVRAELARRGIPLAKMEMDWKATQRFFNTLNGPQQIRIQQAIGTASGSLDKIEGLYDEWKKLGQNSGIRIFNKAALEASKQLPGRSGAVAQALDAQIADLTAELGVVYMGGNSPTDHALGLASKNLSADWNSEQFEEAMKQARQNIKIRENSIKNSYSEGISGRYLPNVSGQGMNGPPGPPATGGELPPQAKSQLKEGVHTTFKNGQTWTLQNGQPVQIQAQ